MCDDADTAYHHGATTTSLYGKGVRLALCCVTPNSSKVLERLATVLSMRSNRCHPKRGDSYSCHRSWVTCSREGF